MKKYSAISAIIIFGIILRLIFINKPDGLWNDEYVSWMIASVPFNQGFWTAVKSQCHMPFYYLYLKFFMALFGQSDLLLRITSVITGIAAIPVMYLVGCEKDKNTGLMCAGFTAVSSFLIYYSQEVRLYSLLFLLSAACLLYTLKSIKKKEKKNLFLFILFNFFILFTHTIGFVFVFFNLILLSVFIYKKSKKFVILIWSITALSGICLSPLILKILGTQTFSQWWGNFSLLRIGFLFTDYFSPVLTNLTNAPENFFYAPKLVLFMIVPAIIAITGIFKSVIKNKLNTCLLLVVFFTILTLIAASLCGKLVFITKYSIEIYPVLIYLACSGIAGINNKIIRNSIIIIYCLICTGYIFIAPNSAPKIRRAEGHKIMTDILERMELKDNDIILMEYYNSDRFNKYFDFSKYRVVSINKGNFYSYLSEDKSYNDIYKDGKKLYKNMFLSNENQHLKSMLKKEILDNLKPDQSVVMVILNSTAIYNPEQITQIVQNEDLYNKTPFLFLVFSYLKKQTFLNMIESLEVRHIEGKGQWMLIKFTKLNN